MQAIVKEVNDHIENEHSWELAVPVNDVPEGTKILDSVWSMKRKRDFKTCEVYKHKAQLNHHFHEHHVRKGLITIQAISTENQLADPLLLL